MANISITIPDAMMPRVEAAFTSQYNYQDMIPGPPDENGMPTTSVPNPETKPQFVKRSLRDHVKNTVSMYEAQLASQEAAQKAQGDIG